MLVSSKDLFRISKEYRFAIPAPNFYNFDSAKAYVEVAEELSMPLILAFAEVHLEMIDLEDAATIGKYLAKKATVPVVLHLDHGMTPSVIKKAIDLGFSSVMIDASSKPFADNVAMTKDIVEYAHAKGVVVEAEIGYVGSGVNYENHELTDSVYTEVDEAVKFVEETNVDSLAISIGTAHGFYQGTPEINFERLNEIASVIDTPLVLHGGSSSGDKNLNKCALEGISKINIFTDLITACTTGIAHTYMAEKALLEAGKKMGLTIHVEKQGAAGVEDELTQTDIDQADAVVLAIEKGINENRFAGKQVLKVSPGTAIKEAERVINDALEHKNTYLKQVDASETANTQQASAKGVYQHLLAGVSYMIPIVVAGGLAIALSFAFGITAFENVGSLPWALFEIGAGSAMALMFPVLAGFIAYDIADKPGFAPGIIGGFIAHNSGSGFVGAIVAGYLAGYTAQFINKRVKFPNSIQGLKSIVVLPTLTTLIVGLFLLFVVATPIVALQNTVANFLNSLSSNNAGIFLLSLSFSVLYFDLGGPISKMVYSFAVAMLADNIYTTMSAAMIIGMVPPLGVAIATLIKPNYFNKDEQEAGKTAMLLGMSFITEGAIPFAIAHPKQAIPSFMVGGFVGSVISLLFNVGVTAPHGGLFLVFIPNAITNSLLFIVALLAGSIVTAITMLFLMSLNKNKQTA